MGQVYSAAGGLSRPFPPPVWPSCCSLAGGCGSAPGVPGDASRARAVESGSGFDSGASGFAGPCIPPRDGKGEPAQAAIAIITVIEQQSRVISASIERACEDGHYQNPRETLTYERL